MAYVKCLSTEPPLPRNAENVTELKFPLLTEYELAGQLLLASIDCVYWPVLTVCIGQY